MLAIRVAWARRAVPARRQVPARRLVRARRAVRAWRGRPRRRRPPPWAGRPRGRPRQHSESSRAASPSSRARSTPRQAKTWKLSTSPPPCRRSPRRAAKRSRSWMSLMECRRRMMTTSKLSSPACTTTTCPPRRSRGATAPTRVPVLSRALPCPGRAKTRSQFWTWPQQPAFRRSLLGGARATSRSRSITPQKKSTIPRRLGAHKATSTVLALWGRFRPSSSSRDSRYCQEPPGRSREALLLPRRRRPNRPNPRKPLGLKTPLPKSRSRKQGARLVASFGPASRVSHPRG
mmetsp:Transcript_6431/g.22105  ORF Transcript_6431/g.22105 Transcript_6431/m.22105 type:complete len:290 (+) Transcript_6431:431-1300(+)